MTDEEPRPTDADDVLAAEEAGSQGDGTPGEMRPAGEPGRVAEARGARKRVDEEVETEDEPADSPLADEDPADTDTGAQS